MYASAHHGNTCVIGVSPRSSRRSILTDCLPALSSSPADGLGEWVLDIRVLDNNPIYQGQIFRIKFLFPDSYPIEPPEFTFEAKPNRPIPIASTHLLQKHNLP